MSYMDSAGRAAERIYKEVLKDVKPTPSEVKETTNRVNALMLLLKSIVPKDVELRVAGSVARGTNLKGNADVDIFMLFSKRLDRDRIVKMGTDYGKEAARKGKGKFEIKYAEHPYIRLYLDSVGMRADLVPAFKIDNIEDMGTTVDRTPMHTEFINSHLSPKQCDDVRLLKAFMRANHIYGAEVRINGFSGYLCELLVYQYGSIHNLFVEIARAKLPLVIEPKFNLDSANEQLAKKFNSRFVVIDPVDGDRNVAAGVSSEAFARLIVLARRFLKSPGKEYFYPKKAPADPQALVSKFSESTGLDTYLMSFKVPDKSEDVICPQLRKVNQQIVMHIKKNGFNVVLATQFISDNTGFIFIMAPKQQLKSRVLQGPDVLMQNAADDFIKQHKGAFGFTISDTVVYALEKSKYQDIQSILKDLPKTITAHKDIQISAAKLAVNSIPKEHAAAIYNEIQKRLSI